MQIYIMDGLYVMLNFIVVPVFYKKAIFAEIFNYAL